MCVWEYKLASRIDCGEFRPDPITTVHNRNCCDRMGAGNMTGQECVL